MSTITLADRIDGLLPQTQCTKCGYDGCRPYAAAIADGQADINRCPPGGEDGVRALAALLDRAAPPLDLSRGQPGPLMLAVVDEAHCIGCTLCIDACPVDAIVGAAKRMHTVVDELCTGCDLCVAPCPVDCIAMVPAGRAWGVDDARQARERHDRRARRLLEIAGANADTGAGARRAGAPLAAEALRASPAAAEPLPPAPAAAEAGGPIPSSPAADPAMDDAASRRRAAIENALARARARRMQ
ncbi:Ferredoxin [Bordetella sputigena]|uniref:electron transport complex subunit RsxB n=1 Tax=Bordetella sputigena TaxID=1416810 RepID=UPI0039F031CB